MKQRGKKKKKMNNRNEDNLRDLWDNGKHPNIRKSQKKKTKRKAMRKYLRR